MVVATRGLSHINLNVADVNRSIAFYGGLFGMKVIHRYEGAMGPHPWGIQVVLSTPGADDLLALTHAPGLPIGPAGVNHLGFTLVSDDDLDAAAAEAERLGGKLIRGGAEEVDGILEKFAYVSDPDGYAIELNCQRFLLSRKLRGSQ